MQIFHSFDELAAFSAKNATSNMSVFNDNKPPIYDYLGPNFKAGIRRMTDEEIKSATHKLFLQVQKKVMSGTHEEHVTAKIEEVNPEKMWYNAEMEFREILKKHVNIQKMFQEGDWLGALLTEPVLELFPLDMQTAIKNLMPGAVVKNHLCVQIGEE